MIKKTTSCPKCKSKNILPIFYGYPADMEWYLKSVNEKKIVGGGCSPPDANPPKWECGKCGIRWTNNKRLREILEKSGATPEEISRVDQWYISDEDSSRGNKKDD